MLARLLHEPLAGEIGQPLLTLLSLNIDLICESDFFQLTIGAQGWRERRGFERSRQRISEMNA